MQLAQILLVRPSLLINHFNHLQLNYTSDYWDMSFGHNPNGARNTLKNLQS